MTTDVHQVQLVACIRQSPALKTKDCGLYAQGKYQGAAGTEVVIKWHSYTISLYEAKSGTLVTKPVVLDGEADTTCPETVSQFSNDTSPYVQDTLLTAAQVEQALGKYVTSAVSQPAQTQGS